MKSGEKEGFGEEKKGEGGTENQSSGQEPSRRFCSSLIHDVPLPVFFSQQGLQKKILF